MLTASGIASVCGVTQKPTRSAPEFQDAGRQPGFKCHPFGRRTHRRLRWGEHSSAAKLFAITPGCAFKTAGLPDFPQAHVTRTGSHCIPLKLHQAAGRERGTFACFRDTESLLW